MSARKILLFLVSVYALLGAVCLAMPEDGLNIAGMNLHFPRIKDLVSMFTDAEEVQEPSPEELLQMRMAELRKARQSEYDEYLNSSPSRIHFPEGKVELFDPLFAAMDQADSSAMRILHYGDSQLEEDRISHTLRAKLQEEFGGMGPGLQSFGSTRYTFSLACTCNTTLSKIAAFGTAERRSDGRYGVMAQASVLDTATVMSYSSVKNNKTASRYFNKARILLGRIESPVSISCGGKNVKVEKTTSPDGVELVEFRLRDSSTYAKISMNGIADVYGVMLDGDSGISLDNVAMRGCSGTIFTKLNSAQLKSYWNGQNVRLIILQYGGNSVPYCTTGKSISEYKKSVEKQICHIKSLAPNASILFIGPSDMATMVKGSRQTYPSLPMMVDSLKAAANNAGAAYWDMYSAMGGSGSMVKWVKSSPALAGSDYVHFTPKGAEAMGNMLFETLMFYHDYYTWRKKEGE